MEPPGSIASLKTHKGKWPANALGDDLDAISGASLDKGKNGLQVRLPRPILPFRGYSPTPCPARAGHFSVSGGLLVILGVQILDRDRRRTATLGLPQPHARPAAASGLGPRALRRVGPCRGVRHRR
jgi:hypothetical protein